MLIDTEVPELKYQGQPGLLVNTDTDAFKAYKRQSAALSIADRINTLEHKMSNVESALQDMTALLTEILKKV